MGLMDVYLIVSGGGWEPHRDSFGSGRVLEYTDAAIAQRNYVRLQPLNLASAEFSLRPTVYTQQ
jgi:hypothetical protein